MPSSFITLLLVATAQVQAAADPFATFNSNIKACTVIDKAFRILPSKNQDALLTFCNSFVGYTTTTVTGQTDVWVTANIPLKTVTVTGNPKLRYRRAEIDHDEPYQASPTRKIVSPARAASAITPPPRPFGLSPHENQELKRADTKPPTPAIFLNQASLFIRTGCACLGFSTQITMPVFTTTTATSTVPASCARAPVSAYHVSSYGPASAFAAAYDYGPFDIYEPTPDPLGECCKMCQGRGGCVQFTYEKLDYAIHGAYARCSYLSFDDFYNDNGVKGVPRLANEKPYSCMSGYLAVNGLKTDTSSTTSTKATFLGPCAVSTVRAR